MTRALPFVLASIVTAFTSLAAFANPNAVASPGANAETITPVGHVRQSHAAATMEPDATLEETFRQADERFQAADYAQAAWLFTRVWHLAQTTENRDRWGRYTAIFAFNAATSHRLAGNCDAAFMAFSHFVAAFERLSSEEQKSLRQATDLPEDNESWLHELKEECPREPTKDVAEPLPANNPPPAKHSEIQLQPSGNWLLDVNLPNKSKTRSHEEGAESSTPNLGWLLTAGGAASLAVSGYFLWSGIDNNQEATDPSNKHERYTDYAALRDRDYATASIIGALGIGLASVGVYILATSSNSSGNTHATNTARWWLRARGTQLVIGGHL